MRRLAFAISLVPVTLSAQDRSHDFGGAKPIHAETWLSARDYPDSANRRAGGEIDISFEISTAGRVQHCLVIKSSGDVEIDKVPCSRLVKVAEFSPAFDASGNAIVAKAWWQIRF